MRVIAFLALLPAGALAQTFETPPLFSVDGVELHATLTDTCVNAQAALGPDALVSAAARGCIGLSAQDADGALVSRLGLEQAYWEWRIAQNYEGLQAWVADRSDVAVGSDLQASVANPAAATANVTLECALRIEQTVPADEPEQDIAACEMRETALIALELEFTVRQACEGATEGSFAVFCSKDVE